jgi:transposase
MRFECPDDLIPSHHEARVIWAVVCSWDLSGFTAAAKARQGVCGREVTDPRVMAAVWLYGCVRGIGSARELARRCDAGPEGEASRPFLWLCGGVGVNYHTLSDFRVGHAAGLDGLFSSSIAALVNRGLVKVREIAQDGTRVRASAGAGSFRRKSTLEELLVRADAHVAALKSLLEDPGRSAGLSARKKAAMTRAARGRTDRVAAAIALIPQLEEKQRKLAERLSARQKDRVKEPRASTSDGQARVMKMPNGGFNPATNVQVAVDTDSRAIVGVDAVSAGADAGLAEPMRARVEERTGRKVEAHLIDGGYLVTEEVERAAAQGVALHVPPKPPRNKDKRGSEYDPRPGDGEVVKAWRKRMGSEGGKAVYARRASTVETANAQLKRHGLAQLTVRGLSKARCVALWCALAYNLMLFGRAMIG